ncbi:MAG: DUF411 domain-containing protein [Rhodobacterales bacterium]|nr:DUF411 domain-containing protein [Rhodobacterales bacterium]
MTAALNRRTLLASLAASLTLPTRTLAEPLTEAIHVVKDPGCGCCGAWIEHLAAAGLATTVEEQDAEALAAYKLKMGVPAELASCHTASIRGYVLEGHVPAADIRRLLAESPDAVGLAVPGMPYGSPGMGPEAEREAYDVMLILRDGSATVYTSYPAA